MKTTTIILLSALLFSCGGYEKEKTTCQKGKITVLNKKASACARGGGYCYYEMYLYNGTEALWYNTDINTYNSYNINDTLPTIVLTIIKREK